MISQRKDGRGSIINLWPQATSALSSSQGSAWPQGGEMVLVLREDPGGHSAPPVTGHWDMKLWPLAL